jgi:hypothetical protein
MAGSLKNMSQKTSLLITWASGFVGQSYLDLLGEPFRYVGVSAIFQITEAIDNEKATSLFDEYKYGFR